MSTPGFLLTLDTLTPILASVEVEVEARHVLEEMAPEIRQYAQDNAPWADRTGDARRGLSTDVEESEGIVTLTLYHTVDYGRWLETIQAGRFAIILPTIEHFEAEVMRRCHATSEGAEGE